VSSDASDRILLNVPQILSSGASRISEDGSFVPDEDLGIEMKRRLGGLVEYLLSRGLVRDVNLVTGDLAALVLRVSDVTAQGQELWSSGVVYRWLGSFDRSPNKPIDDFKMLDRVLNK
jgi:hypothetical protein